jgi:hypothetical protein
MPEPPGTGAGSTPGRRAPAVALTAPVPRATFSSALNMAATAIDDHGVSRVEFWVDGARVARDTAAPYAAFTANRAMS